MKRTNIYTKFLLFISFLIIGDILCNAQNSVDLTYIANSGFLIKGTSQKIFIDGLFDEDYNQFHKPASDVINSAIKGGSPFTGISHILISHSDKDHFKASYTMEQMLNNTNAWLISTDQVKNQLESSQSFNNISGRTFLTKPPAGDKTEETINGLPFKIMFLQHGEDQSFKKENLGIMFTIDGIKFFHVGDANSANLNEFETLDLANESIDVAFIPYWLFESAAGRQIIRYINAKAIVLMHLTLGSMSKYISQESTYEDLPSTYFFNTMMTKSIVSLNADESISIKGALEIDYAGVSDINFKDQEEYRIYPNPANNYLYISIPDKFIGNKIEIFNTMGEPVYANIVETEQLTVELTNYKPGIYVVRINNLVNNFIIR